VLRQRQRQRLVGHIHPRTAGDNPSRHPTPRTGRWLRRPSSRPSARGSTPRACSASNGTTRIVSRANPSSRPTRTVEGRKMRPGRPLRGGIVEVLGAAGSGRYKRRTLLPPTSPCAGTRFSFFRRSFVVDVLAPSASMHPAALFPTITSCGAPRTTFGPVVNMMPSHSLSKATSPHRSVRFSCPREAPEKAWWYWSCLVTYVGLSSCAGQITCVDMAIDP
jgi:hypothetical protein